MGDETLDRIAVCLDCLAREARTTSTYARLLFWGILGVQMATAIMVVLLFVAIRNY